ncbi:MAG TPA: dipeptide epimerase [Polyangiaceae bacterium]|nr:dipeptide epimerase [Polyangiaceae bacterium]
MLRVHEFGLVRLDVPLLEPFGIATGAQHVAHNVLVRLKTDLDSIAWGEAAPVQHISGETQDQVCLALEQAAPVIARHDLLNYRPLCEELHALLAPVPSALAAVETAIFDAICKHHRITLLQFFGAHTASLDTDITITTGSVDDARRAAQKYLALGFSRFKIKIGGHDTDEDVRRVLALAQLAPHAGLILDGNTAFSARAAITFMKVLGEVRRQVLCFEQPVAREDWEGLQEVEREASVCVVADESMRGEEDLRRLLKLGGVSGINIKTAKLGLLRAWELLISARSAGLAIMVGGMVETEMSMTTSACLAAGVGGVDFVDLDTPLLLGPRPLRGGFIQTGPKLDLSRLDPGHGVEFIPDAGQR